VTHAMLDAQERQPALKAFAAGTIGPCKVVCRNLLRGVAERLRETRPSPRRVGHEIELVDVCLHGLDGRMRAPLRRGYRCVMTACAPPRPADAARTPACVRRVTRAMAPRSARPVPDGGRRAQPRGGTCFSPRS
jgi:hypothetical protein